ncbi:MAG: hypothetical protein K0S57_4119, partial [Ramlibacter sp.]|nr:hypothetical protein [Ramlibacter sp.]
MERQGGAKKDAKASVVKKAHGGKSYLTTRTVAVKKRTRSVVRLVPAKPSHGQMAGLHTASDELDLRSSV